MVAVAERILDYAEPRLGALAINTAGNREETVGPARARFWRFVLANFIFQISLSRGGVGICVLARRIHSTRTKGMVLRYI